MPLFKVKGSTTGTFGTMRQSVVLVINMARAEMRRVNADHSLDLFLVLVNVIRRATGDPDSLTIARDICPTLAR